MSLHYFSSPSSCAELRKLSARAMAAVASVVAAVNCFMRDSQCLYVRIHARADMATGTLAFPSFFFISLSRLQFVLVVVVDVFVFASFDAVYQVDNNYQDFIDAVFILNTVFFGAMGVYYFRTARAITRGLLRASVMTGSRIVPGNSQGTSNVSACSSCLTSSA